MPAPYIDWQPRPLISGQLRCHPHPSVCCASSPTLTPVPHHSPAPRVASLLGPLPHPSALPSRIHPSCSPLPQRPNHPSRYSTSSRYDVTQRRARLFFTASWNSWNHRALLPIDQPLLHNDNQGRPPIRPLHLSAATPITAITTRQHQRLLSQAPLSPHPPQTRPNRPPTRSLRFDFHAPLAIEN